MSKYNIRSLSWGAANISWSVVIEEILNAAEQNKHKVAFLSTNGYDGMQYWDSKKGLEHNLLERDMKRKGQSFDIDITYTVPENFKDRFLDDSRCKMAIYAYESSIMPDRWRKDYALVDYMLPPSQYVAEMMLRNGCPKDKIRIVPHGVDTDVFNPDIKPLKIKTEKKIKMLCVAEPHMRKQLDKLLDLYCRTFTIDDDITFILKTKLFKFKEELNKKKEFEMNLIPIIAKIREKYGKRMPEIKVIGHRVKNIASLYAACDFFALMTASEGWGVPYLEALAMGIPVIAPRHGGQLQFLNDGNAILTKCGIRKARHREQYWGGNPKAVVGNPDEKDFKRAMRQTYEDLSSMRDEDKKGVCNKYEEMRRLGLSTAHKLTWNNAMQEIIKIAKGHNGE